jgi:hypothetical protein
MLQRAEDVSMFPQADLKKDTHAVTLLNFPKGTLFNRASTKLKNQYVMIQYDEALVADFSPKKLNVEKSMEMSFFI